jgi:hypothetical protein
VKAVVVAAAVILSGLFYHGLVGGYNDSTLRVKVVYSSEMLVPSSQTAQFHNPYHSVLNLLIHFLYYENSFNISWCRFRFPVFALIYTVICMASRCKTAMLSHIIYEGERRKKGQ